MPFPVDALVWRTVDQILPGRVFLLAGNWWLRVMAQRGNNVRNAGLQLTGEGAGRLLAANQTKALTFDPPYAWAPMVTNLVDGSLTGNVMASLSISPDGPTIWGQFAPGHEHCFLLDGTDVSDSDIADFDGNLRFQQWKGVLNRENTMVADLFHVDRVR